MHSDLDITIWLDKLDQQPDDAMQKIWEAYYEKLVRHARRKLASSKNRVADEEDVAIEALNSFFQAAEKGKFPKLQDRNDLWKLLLTLTSRKASNKIREQGAQKRGGNAIRGESVFLKANGEQTPGLAGMADPSPEFCEIFAEELFERLDRLGDERLREIAVLKLDGYTSKEIAARLNVAVRTIERKLDRIRVEWDDARK